MCMGIVTNREKFNETYHIGFNENEWAYSLDDGKVGTNNSWNRLEKSANTIGSLVSCEVNRYLGSVKFYVNGEDLGEAF